jgi:hypothetical protein
MSLQTQFAKVLINGVECLLVGTRDAAKKIRTNKDYPFKYDLRHGDDGEPWSIERKVAVNYFGTILAPESFLKNGKRTTTGKKYKDIDVCKCGCGYPSFLYIES